jgi:hypothetical protein
MASEEKPDIGELFAQRAPIQEALNEAVRDAVRQHRQAGLPMAVWKDGKVAWVSADEVDIKSHPTEPPRA